MFELANSYYAEAAEHEASLVCLLLIDRTGCRWAAEVEADSLLDPLWRLLLKRLQADCWRSVEQLTIGLDRGERLQIAAKIACLYTLRPKVFKWNLRWHIAEIQRLRALRDEFAKSIDFVFEHAESLAV